jgi:membrane protein required for colicin V production
MNSIDIIVCIILLVFAVRGVTKGFVHELFSLIIIVSGLALAVVFYRPFSSVVRIFVENDDLASILSFIALFVGATLVLVVIRNALSGLVESLNITDVNAALGLVVGVSKGALLCSVLLVFFTYRRVLNLHRVIDDSFLFPYLKRFLLAILSLLPDTIQGGVVRFLGGL